MGREFVPFLEALRGAPRPAAAPSEGGFVPLPPPPVSPVTETAAAERSAASAPTVTLQRDGERITQIQIRCACGEVIELDCLY
jgi:hypothetical protein